MLYYNHGERWGKREESRKVFRRGGFEKLPIFMHINTDYKSPLL